MTLKTKHLAVAKNIWTASIFSDFVMRVPLTSGFSERLSAAISVMRNVVVPGVLSCALTSPS